MRFFLTILGGIFIKAAEALSISGNGGEGRYLMSSSVKREQTGVSNRMRSSCFVATGRFVRETPQKTFKAVVFISGGASSFSGLEVTPFNSCLNGTVSFDPVKGRLIVTGSFMGAAVDCDGVEVAFEEGDSLGSIRISF